MRYNKWKEANDYWRMVINKPFKIRGRNVMLLNYIENYSRRQNKSSYVTKVMYRFISYLNTIGNEIYSCTSILSADKHFLLYTGSYTKELIGINPYISITYEQVNAITNFKDAYSSYYNSYYSFNRSRVKKSIVNNLLDAIDEISPIQDVLRQHKYNKRHRRKHPYPVVNDNIIERSVNSPTHYYDDYKRHYLDCLKQDIDITKTFYKYHLSLDSSHIFTKLELNRR